MIGHRLFASEAIGNLFYLHAVIFEISRQYFIIKTYFILAQFCEQKFIADFNSLGGKNDAAALLKLP